jgi:O-antigen ligase/polysaccharide polymerase Wzy-like membrane protein
VNNSPRISKANRLEWCTAAHACVMVVGVTWAFGGNADWVRTPIEAWGSLGILIWIFAALSWNSPAVNPGVLRWAWPVLVLNALVGASCLTPGLKPVHFGTQTFLMPVSMPWWVPSAAQPRVTLDALWMFDAIYFSCLNVALAVIRRRVLRIVLAVTVANAAVLSAFGTIQKLAGSTGIYFGAVKTPQAMFFSSFVYDNHWGAFAILSLCACIGLVVRYSGGMDVRGFFHSPAFTGFIAAIVIGASIPLSGSRACTFLLCMALVIAIGRTLPRISRGLGASGATSGAKVAVTVAAALLVLCAVWLIAGQVIKARAETTRDQVATMWANGSIGSRATLYHDTWRMARQRIPFGWGMGSYPRIFLLYNTQESKIDRIPVVYHDAHSDWLQSVAEIGFAGAFLVGAAVLMPLMSIRRHALPPISFFLLTGCALVAAYAWVEFPFGNVAVVLVWWLSFLTAVQYARSAALQGGHSPR